MECCKTCGRCPECGRVTYPPYYEPWRRPYPYPYPYGYVYPSTGEPAYPREGIEHVHPFTFTCS